MADTFNFDIRAEPAGDVMFRTLKAEFGDGYSQAAADGINNKTEQWAIEAVGCWVTGTPIGHPVKQIADFLDLQQGFNAFNWTPPAGVAGLYRCDGYRKTSIGGGLYTIAATFYQVFG